MSVLLKNCLFIFGIALIIFGCTTPENESVTRLYLHENWQLKSMEDSVWLPATVPGNVHTDLYDNQIIPHPFVKDNESQLQWISDKGWEYRTSFSLDENALSKNHIRLNFEGLDTYASVYLNDSLILKANNAFRHWNADVASLLKEENTLRIVFEPTSLTEQKESEKLAYTLPEGNRVFTRKAQFQYGWDWGPQFNTSGIWRDVYLEFWDVAKIEDVYIRQEKLDDASAKLTAQVDISENDGNLSLEIRVNGKKAASQKIPHKGKNTLFEIPFEIKNPKRWWTHNLGESYLYDITVLLKNDNGLLDSLSLKKGLRTIELVTEKDNKGESFYFKLNGEPVFMKGANYIPQNSFQNWVTDAHYEKLLNDVVEANMNMLRVWGGGMYENDVFYALCDEKGILVWQDFMFACAMYPGDEAFLENVQQEAVNNVKRLRNYSSIALWCGNNESSEGWHRWGWQNGRSENEKKEIWQNYLKVFDSILPNTVNELTDVPYWETSPKFGRGDARYISEGDAHDWWIWHDGHPFENLEEKVPRFMSEFGFQAFPGYEVIRFINDTDNINISSPAFKPHQKHRTGFETIKMYMERDFPVPDTDEDYVYMSQLLQAYDIGKGIEAHRRAKPYTMGSLYWQLNDCWPVVSWSGIDFFGNWKALHYQAKHSFENLLVSFEKDDKMIKVYVVNDDLEPKTSILELKAIDFDGNLVWQSQKEIKVDKNSSDIYVEIPVSYFKGKEKEIVLEGTFNNAVSLFYLVKPKELALKQCEIKQIVSKTESGFSIELSSETLQKNVFLYSDAKGHFNENYFDLLPHRTKIIHFRTESEQAPEVYFKVLNEFVN